MEAYREAFEKVFRDHLTQVEQLIARHTKDPDERMDLTQEVFIRAYSAFSQFRGEANVGTWLHRITVNVCTNAARSRKRRREEPLENLEPLDGFEGLYDVVEDLAHSERQRMMKRAMRLLSAEQLVVLTLRFSDQLTVPEIAEVVGVPVDTVKSRLKAALSKVQSAVGYLESDLAVIRGGEQDNPEAVSLDEMSATQEAAGRIYHNLGSLYLRKGLIEAALKEWRKAQKVAPHFLDAYLASAQQYIETSRPRKAVEVLETAVGKIQSADLHTDLGRLYLDLGDIEDGFEHATRAIDLDPNSPDAHFQVGRAYSRRAELQEALRSLSVASQGPEDAAQTNWRRSARHYERAIELRPGFFRATAALSQSYYLDGMPEQAERAARQAVDAAGDDEFVLHTAGWVHYKTGKLELAERYLRHSISQKATAYKLSLLGLVYLAMDRCEEAYVAFTEGLNYAGDNRARGQLYANLAASAIELGRFEEAADAAEAAIRLDPGQIHARCNLSHAYLEMGTNPHVVVKLCREGLQKSPAHRCFHQFLGEAHLRLGDYEEALAEAAIAVELEPDRAKLWFLKARILDKLGRAGEAQNDLRMVLGLDPSHEGAQVMLRRLLPVEDNKDAQTPTPPALS
jgi:RNA polymerase sigma-70 factor (ECF subfamily)